MTYAQNVGERLRNIRLQKGLSLHDVELASSKEFKASVLGAYERGERSISVPRLQRLARFYTVPVDHLLPRDLDGDDLQPAPIGAADRVTIDLRQLDAVDAPESTVLQRYLNMVQMQRGDFNGKVLTIRHEDLRAIACLFETTTHGMRRRLDEMSLLR
jgi:transcriptional regulator with XRE-family HTH domain